MAVQKEQDTVIDYGDVSVTGGLSVFSEEFDHAFYYDGDDLGVTCREGLTRFRLWAPTASEAQVLLYESAQGSAVRVMQMKRSDKGTWLLEVNEPLAGFYYTYLVKIGSQWNEAADPYAAMVGVNGERAYIGTLEQTDPEGWGVEKPAIQSPLDAVIYELHVRDLSIHPESGIRHKGKFLGLAEEGTTGPDGIHTGLDHIVNLGVTHVQLLPIFDISSVSIDEASDTPAYNWGYDPQNYNAPEGIYATDPHDPVCRVRELKQLIHTLHRRGLRVIMDVVYNHVYDGYRANLAKLVPGYYMRHWPDRTLSNGSHCGNDVASERPMVRKFIVDSILHWAKNYRIDGFRFDLMGLLDIESMLEVKQKLHEIDPSILIIGEGWMMNTALPEDQRADMRNAARLPGIGIFNDQFRDTVKGKTLEPTRKGFVNGSWDCGYDLKRAVVGGTAYDSGMKIFADEPVQSVNFVECHDNHTLWDKLSITNPDDPEPVRRQMHRLATSIVLTSQGIAFLHAGQEFMRTKQGIENSYKCGDDINALDWHRCARHQDHVEHVRALIQIRKEHPAFRLRTTEEIRSHLVFEPAPDARSLAFTLRNHAGGDATQHLLVLYHASQEKIELQLPQLGEWKTLYTDMQLHQLDRQQAVAEGIGTLILAIN
ncbi:type I pullulanase [Paenibacillus sambharensis]|uniref:Type I pullulanase n=1 Tax=Paenibacillus sambharensis TaxID=1803190 RepID=A0A2W1LZV5_9BACL|nr:type I pullulanase [Paenibacillus sambharensis]PZD97007.1 type I pullulanase [Paenibacillus sambharensis]